MTTLDAALMKITAGDYVTARGTDTRGHEVTRTGTLLAPPQKVKAQFGGRKEDAVRLCIGLAGTDPSQRSTWTTLFPDFGFVEPTRKPTSNDWTNGPLSKVPGMRTADEGVVVRFGGKGGKRSTEPAKPALARIRHVDNGRYEIRDVATDEVLLTVAWQTAIWWAPAPEDETGDGEPAADEHEVPVEEAPPVPPAQARRGVLYEGWLSAEEHTELGRAVLHLTSGRVIGWLTTDGQFRPAA
ncbi:hypothetical protein [Streptomyces mashuensis]|nr:hypothetical protein [Streptomyces mashuensis]